MGGEGAPRRHALAWIRPGDRAAVRPDDPAHADEVARWLARGLPAVVRRRDPSIRAHEVALAIVLPNALGRARIALVAPAEAVERIGAPIALAEAIRSAPDAWVPPLAALDAEARREGIVLRAYGSLAWQHLTGEAYLRPGSDVDLLAPGAGADERARSLAVLGRWAAHAEPRLDGEVELGGGRAAAWRELLGRPARVLVKSAGSVTIEDAADALGPHAIDAAALAALLEELEADPKPGLVSPSTRGAHGDMDARTFAASLGALRGAFAEAAAAGAAGAPFDALRAIGVTAEARMLAATGGVNTHRGAIFALGLLAAAAGRLLARGRRCTPGALGREARSAFGAAVLALAPAPGSHGAAARDAHGVPGAREEAARGFPHVLEVGLPALDESVRRGAPRAAAAVQALFAIVARLPDTNLLHRGGAAGLALARRAAAEFLAEGGVHRPGWRRHAREIDRAFVARNLSPGGSADLLAATLFVDRLRSVRPRPRSPALLPGPVCPRLAPEGAASDARRSARGSS